MSEASTPEGTGGLSEAQAVDKLEALLSGNGHGEGDETEGETPQSEDEDEPDEGEAEPEEESEDDEEVAPSEQELNDETAITFKVGDEDVTATLHELKRGFLREQDYTRKTQALSDKAKAYDAERAEFAPLAERTKALLDHLEAAYRAPLYDEQELAQLRYTDPAEWSARCQEMAERQRQVDLILGHKSELSTFDQAERQRQTEATMADVLTKQAEAETKLLEERPAWAKNPALAKAAVERVSALGQQLALTPDEWLSVRTDHRMFLILDDAAQYRALKLKTPQIQQNLAKVKTAAPGAKASAPSKVTEVTRAKQRLAKTGDVNDAALAIERMLGQ